MNAQQTSLVSRSDRGTGSRFAAALVVTGCLFCSAGCDNALQGGVTGAGLGALVGLGLGSLTGDMGKGAAAGALIGALGGALVGDQNRRSGSGY